MIEILFITFYWSNNYFMPNREIIKVTTKKFLSRDKCISSQKLSTSSLKLIWDKKISSLVCWPKRSLLKSLLGIQIIFVTKFVQSVRKELVCVQNENNVVRTKFFTDRISSSRIIVQTPIIPFKRKLIIIWSPKLYANRYCNCLIIFTFLHFLVKI